MEDLLDCARGTVADLSLTGEQKIEEGLMNAPAESVARDIIACRP